MSTRSPSDDLPAMKPTSNLALISLIAGILGLTLFPVVGSVVAVLLGRMAKQEIQDSAETLSGMGLAQAGEVLGWIGIALGVLGMCAVVTFVAIPACFAFFVAIANVQTSSLWAPLLLALV